jgi:hypothetical protein
MSKKIIFLTKEQKEKRRIDKNLKNKIWRQKNPDKYKAILERDARKKREKWATNHEYRIKRSKQIAEYQKNNPDIADKTYQNLLNSPEKKLKKKIRDKIWYEKNYDRYYAKQRERVLRNPELYREFKKKWLLNPENLKKAKNSKKKYTNSEHGRKAYNEYRRNKLKNDPVFRISVNLRLRLRAIIKQQGGKGKYAKMLEIVGMDWVSFKKYIENKFKPGMTWDNYGSHWHLDHIKAITKFDLLTQLGQKQSCHYTNLQPLWALENLKKGNR